MRTSSLAALAVIAQQDNTHPRVRAVLACVHTHLRALVAETRLDHTKIVFDAHVSDSDRLTLTDARKLKLTDDDLEILPFKQKYVRAYGTMATYFNRLDVLGLRLAKYGSFHVKKTSAARERRIARLVAARIDPRHVCAERFVANGKGGVASVRANLRAYGEADASEAEWRQIFAGAITIETVRRRARLTAALAEYGLALREDSLLCQRFIHRNVGDADQIAVEMRIMHVLHDQTNYVDVLRCFSRRFGRFESSKRAKKIVMENARYAHLFHFLHPPLACAGERTEAPTAHRILIRIK